MNFLLIIVQIVKRQSSFVEKNWRGNLKLLMFPILTNHQTFAHDLVYLRQREDLNILSVLKSISAIMENTEIKLP